MDKLLVWFLAVFTVVSLAEAGLNARSRRDVEEQQQKWIFEALDEIGSDGIVKRAVNPSNTAVPTSKPARGKSARKATEDSPITYLKPSTQKPPSTTEDPSPKSSSIEESTTVSSSNRSPDVTPDSSETPDVTPDSVETSDATTSKASTKSNPVRTTTRPTTAKPSSASPKPTVKPNRSSNSPKPNDRALSNDSKEPSDDGNKNPDLSTNAIPGVGTRSNFDDGSTPTPTDEKSKAPSNKPNASSSNSKNKPSVQPLEETFDFPNYGSGVGPTFGPRIDSGLGYPGYNPAANAGNFAWTQTGPTSAGASAGAFASAGAVSGTGFSTFPNTGSFPNNNQGPPAYSPNNVPAIPTVGNRGSFPDNNQMYPGYNSYGGVNNQPGTAAPTIVNPAGYPQNEIYSGYIPNVGGSPNYGPSGGYFSNQPFPAYGSNYEFGFNPFGTNGGAFPNGFPEMPNAHDMIRRIQDQIRAQQASIDAQIRQQQDALGSNAWASASLTNVGDQIDPYTYAHTQTSSDSNTNFYSSFDGVGNDGYNSGTVTGNGGFQGNGPHTAISSISVGPDGGYQAGQISPVGPGIESRFAEGIRAPTGNKVAVFSSSKSSTRVGPDGKVYSEKSATTGINDNGQIYTKTVHDP